MRTYSAAFTLAALLLTAACGDDANGPINVDVVPPAVSSQAATTAPIPTKNPMPTKKQLGRNYLAAVAPFNRAIKQYNKEIAKDPPKLSELKKAAASVATANWRSMRTMRDIKNSIDIPKTGEVDNKAFYTEVLAALEKLIENSNNEQNFWTDLSNARTLGEFRKMESSHTRSDMGAARNIRLLLDLDDIPGV